MTNATIGQIWYVYFAGDVVRMRVAADHFKTVTLIEHEPHGEIRTWTTTLADLERLSVLDDRAT